MKRPNDKILIIAFATLIVSLLLSTTALVARASVSNNGGTWTDGYNAGTHDGQQSGYASGYNQGYSKAKADAVAQAQKDSASAYAKGQADAKAANYKQGKQDMHQQIFDWMDKNCKTEYVAEDMGTELVCSGISQPADMPAP
jgi:hypothetical protein